ncbi:FepA family TonB-dependent siderophore receptor [Pseudooceanicola sp. CBS1P-1]|uniref:TonB-dependent siderophore receptor n=1 Tax=Pseudooceanicola albus TaxID=2692189 RepID=A0A6L7G6L9_9RHOB|nr:MULTISPECIES: FepA family TonB-dependent siderophore receptor [Pseudooceanicola]MBT9384166.1 FepA family TonB-dependent siderophore receptor [Pseudooceanicola endophyticus]MXN19735.1 TonB-dependent siderophore receptor [Pseudooceanicola albus]
MACSARLASGTALALLLSAGLSPVLAQDTSTLSDTDTGDVLVLDAIDVNSYEQEVLQSLGVSVISAEKIAEAPVANDISELVRKMPGVNLTGASSSGQRGNQRQIDIRGMGPENTLILIDGKPVLSRDAVKMGRAGERDSRGDSNWVPAELIERIEVIRGPAAARYGSGAAGGVVNIITKQPEKDLFQLSMSYNQPESSLEGGDKRANFLWAKPIGDSLSLRLTGNYNHSDPDDPDINAATVAEDDDAAAGSEGVINKDLTALLSWTLDDQNKIDFELGYSKQSNLYAGDTQLSMPTDASAELAESGATTNKMTRTTASVTHTGRYAVGELKSYLQWEHTNNTRLSEGASGSREGAISSTDEWGTVTLDNVAAKTELTRDGQFLGREAKWTYGGELRFERMDDPVSITARGDIDFSYGDTVASAEDRDPVSSQMMLGAYAEGNILWTDRLSIAPSLRVDHADTFGTNISGALNASYEMTSSWTLKAGVAQAFKAPNLYQLNPNYIYTTRGNGCPYPYYRNGPCYVLGNEDLNPERSLNTELGVAYAGPSGIEATLTAFYNDYHDKIQAGTDQVAELTVDDSTYRVYQWENIPRAVVSGVEGSFQAQLREDLLLTTNLTYMIRSENKETGDPLSLVPKYTINAALEWQATERLKLVPSLTHYGKIEAAETSATTGYAEDDTTAQDPYTLVNLTAAFEVREGFTIKGGVTNLFDKQILRSDSGAQTYNEPGRAYFLGLTTTF